MTGEDTPRPAGIGARLRAGRERLGLTLLQAAEKLHLSANIVEALEHDRFDELGAAVFVRGHVRRYAELVHESVPQLLEQFEATARTLPAPDLRRVPRMVDPEARPTGGLLIPGFAIVAAVGVVGIIWWGAHGFSGQGAHLLPAQAQPFAAVSAPSASAPVPATLAAAPGVTAAPGAAAAPAPASARPGPRTASLGTAPLPGAAGLTELTLHFAADSWAEVYDANGDRKLYDLVPGSSERAVRAQAPLRVVLGNADAVTLEVDGREVPIPGRLLPGRAVQLILDGAGHAVRTHSPAAAAAVAARPATAEVRPAAAAAQPAAAAVQPAPVTHRD
ncbi:MAG TPA: RodZ domain-containing protein [Steroidobacteraceae bacterium]|nr:RodZ domain-containing protein [Steroidobacteraceae bacterium]